MNHTAIPAPAFGQVLRELGRLIDDHNLPTPLTITLDSDIRPDLIVAVNGPAHAAWFAQFGDLYMTRDTIHGVEHRSAGTLPQTGTTIRLFCYAPNELPSAVAEQTPCEFDVRDNWCLVHRRHCGRVPMGVVS